MDVAALLAAAKTSGPTGSGSVEALCAAAKSAQGRGCEEALLKAARAGDVEQLKLVIDSNKGLNLNCRGSWDGQTALGWAVEKGHMEVVQRLLAAGADVNAKDSNSWTPLMVAVSKNRHKLARSLISSGADLAPKLRGRLVDWTAHALDADMRAILSSKDAGAPSGLHGADVPMSMKRNSPDSPPSSRTRAARQKRVGHASA